MSQVTTTISPFKRYLIYHEKLNQTGVKVRRLTTRDHQSIASIKCDYFFFSNLGTGRKNRNAYKKRVFFRLLWRKESVHDRTKNCE